MGAITDPEIRADLGCPGCAGSLDAWPLDPQLAPGLRSDEHGTGPRIHGCRDCGGAWLNRVTMDALVDEASSQAPEATDRRSLPRSTVAAHPVVYRRCPSCAELMHRRNFAQISGVIIDECTCGSYFDAGELESIVAFVRAGGLSVAKATHEYEDLQHSAAAVRAQMMRIQATPASTFAAGLPQSELVLMLGFLRWASRWIRDLGARTRDRLNSR